MLMKLKNMWRKLAGRQLRESQVTALMMLAFAASLLPLDGGGFVPSGEDCLTPAPGIFAAGDCRAKAVRQLTTACADGAVAALTACQYCRELSR